MTELHRRRNVRMGVGVVAAALAATITAGGAQARDAEQSDLYVTSRGTPCEAIIGVHGGATAVQNVHLHAPGGVDRDQGPIEPNQSIAVLVPGCTVIGSSSFQFVWVTGDGPDANPRNNAAFV